MMRLSLPPIVVACFLLHTPCGAQGRDFSKVEIKAQPVRGSIHMLTGAGGNMALSVGDDGPLLVDDQFAPLSKKIQAAIRKLDPKPLKFVINTHWHGDHSGGNANLAKAGAVIVAHANVRKRLSTKQFVKAFQRAVPPSDPAAWPVVTFQRSVTLHQNGETVRVIHVGPAHTDGDSLIKFERANVLHTGDTFFNGFYPFIDESSGASLTGLIDAASRSLALCNDETKIIPGHGPLATPGDLRRFQAMLIGVRKEITALLDAGKDLEQIVEARPTRAYDAKWGGGFLTPERWTRIVTGFLLAERKRAKKKGSNGGR